MAVNRNFVVKNGLEVSQDLILANDTTRRIGIGSTVPEFTLDVRGGIGASTVYVSGIATINVGVVTTLQGTNLNYSGISTITSLRGTTAEYDTFYGDVGIITSFNTTGIGTIETKLNVGAGGTVLTAFVNAGVGSVGIGTSLPAYTLDIRGPVSTGVTALYVQGDVRITGDINVDDITFDQADISYLNVTGFATVSNLFITGIGSITSQVGLVTNITGTNLNYSGIGTVVNLTGTNLNYTGVGTINTLYGTGAEFDNLYADVGIVTTLTGTDLSYSGVGTIGTLYGTNAEFDNLYADVGIVTTLTGTDLSYSGVGTIGTLYGTNAEFDNVYADVGIVTNVTSTNLNVTGIATIATVSIAGAALSTLTVSQSTQLSGITTINQARVDNGIITSLNVTGVSTLSTVQISSGIITASSGIVTYYGDGSYLTGNARNLTATIGIGTSGVPVGYGVSFLDLRGPGLSTVNYNNDVGIATIFFQGGGSGSASIGIGTTPGEAFPGIVTTGNLWYNNNLGRLFIYYQDTDSEQWVDASPSNVGIITSLINVSFAPGTAISPSMYFIGDNQTGFFSPTPGEFTVVSVGSSILNINPGGIRVTGIATAQDFDSLSDINYKENVTTVNNALLKVEQMRGVKFDWKESGNPSYGVIAQELEQVLPELVHGNDPKTVNYNGIIGVLIEAIKELKAEVEELKNAK